MVDSKVHFWAKTVKDADGQDTPGISVRDHCLNVGCVAEALEQALSSAVRTLLPSGAATLAALHDIGKITVGFQAKCPHWLTRAEIPNASPGQVVLSVSDHALVSQVFLQRFLQGAPTRLWAVAIGAHHGRPKGRNARLNAPEALADWAEMHRRKLTDEFCDLFGPLPSAPPEARFAPHHADLWLLAGLITVADWIGSNEAWFSPARGLSPDAARRQARDALTQIGWPGGKLRETQFSASFSDGHRASFDPNPLQLLVADAARQPGLMVIEGPMGCGKTEAALYAAQQLIAGGHQHGIYFALPTQVTSNRIHKRIGAFLRNTLAEEAPVRLAHGNAWLEDDFDIRLHPSFMRRAGQGDDDPEEAINEARSWFSTPKQALLATYGVGTVDQALQSVVAVKHFFVRRFALAGKVVILDEVHSYDIYTGTLITALIRELMHLRCSVIILSATLTAARRRELLAAAGVAEPSAPATYPLVTFGTCDAHCWHVSPSWPHHRRIRLRAAPLPESEAVAELISRAMAGQHVLWIRNTVIEAQAAFRAVVGTITESSVPVGLLHSRFPFHRRATLEDEWLERLGGNRGVDGPGSILIATQVVEQSVDIDLDFMISDLAPTDMLLQRVGRLWRHDRPQRHAMEPEFWVRLPELSSIANGVELKRSLGRSSRVYAPYVLLRTMAIWRARTEMNLPHDIRALLEATYAEPDPGEPQAWRVLHAELEQEKAVLAANAAAATRVLANPMLADNEEVLTRRKGAPTRQVVLLRALSGGSNGLTTLVALDGTRAEVSDHEWLRASARFLHRSIVRTPRWMVPMNAPCPPWLSKHGLPHATVGVVRDDGRCVFGEHVSAVTYDPRIGIFAERDLPATSEEWKEIDDEFDY